MWGLDSDSQESLRRVQVNISMACCSRVSGMLSQGHLGFTSGPRPMGQPWTLHMFSWEDEERVKRTKQGGDGCSSLEIVVSSRKKPTRRRHLAVLGSGCLLSRHNATSVLSALSPASLETCRPVRGWPVLDWLVRRPPKSVLAIY